MTMTTLFGLTMMPLFMALAQVESDRGETSENVYQIRKIYVDDVNRISGKHFTYEDRFNRAKSEEMMIEYWRYYGQRYHAKTGKTPSYEILARIHNGGPLGWARESTANYWARVKRVLDLGV